MILGDEFFAQIFDVRRGRAGCQRLFARSFQVFPLPQIADHGDHFAAVIFFQPRNNDRGIQPAGIGEHNFFRQFVLLVVVTRIS